MTEEEEFEFRLRRERELAAAQADEGMSALDTARGAIEAFNQGTTFGWGDEIVGAARAALDRFLPNAEYDFGEGMVDESTVDRPSAYEMYRDDQRNVADDFRDEHAKTALALELVGGMASPINVLGPGVQAAKSAGALRTAGTVGLRGAVEGALAGAGAAEDMTDPLRSIGGGALTGGVLAGTFGGVGRGLTSRKVDEELISDQALKMAKEIRRRVGREAASQFLEDSFTPIHMTADDNLLTDVYREGVGRIAGAASKLRNQEKSFVKAAKQGYKAAKEAKKEVFEEVADRPAFTNAMQEIETNAAREQAKKSVSQAMIDTPSGMKIFDDIDTDKFDPEQIATRLREHWSKEGFREIKDLKFDVDDELVAIMKKHFPDDDVEEALRKNVTGKRLMDLRNEFRVAANKPKADMKGAEARKYAQEIDDWMMSRMEGGRNGPQALRFQDELDAWGEYQAYRRGLRGQDKGRFNINQLARGRGVKGEEGTDFGQQAARRAKGAMEAEKVAEKVAKRETKDAAQAGLDKAKAQYDTVRGRRAPKASGLSELFTTRWAGALADMAVRGAALPAGIGVGQAVASIPGQRFAAGQTGWQRALQDDEVAKLMAQLLRQSASRIPAGE